jgi:hypothetical protein
MGDLVAGGLDLATIGADDAFVFALRDTGSSSPLWGLRFIEVAALAQGFGPYLIDPAMLGAFYDQRVRLQTNPWAKFAKNLTDLRIEGNALFRVRNIAGAYVIGVS